MTKTRRKRLTLDCFNLKALEGSGDKLVVVLEADRTTKAGTPERYELRLEICRWGVHEFLDHVKKMHVRDRERIKAELERIEAETTHLVQK